MIEAIKNWILFWWECFVQGLSIADGVISLAGSVFLIVAAIIGVRRKKDKKWDVKRWEEIVMKWAAWGGLGCFVMTTVLIAPYEKLESLASGRMQVHWTPPKLHSGAQTVVVTCGGAVDAADKAVVRGNYVKTIDAVSGVSRATWAMPVTWVITNERCYADVELPTKTKPIEVQLGNTGLLPEGWEWNSDETALEIVDEQNKPVLQVEYFASGVVRVMGTLEYDGTVYAFNEGGQVETSPVTYWRFSQAYLRQLFRYPAKKNRGIRFQR
jgi:hypothetical protein